MLVCTQALLLSGCCSSTSAPPRTASGVYVASATQWSSEHPGPTYLTVSSLASDTGQVRWRHREEWFPYHASVGDPVVLQGTVYLVADTNTTSTDIAQLTGVLVALRADNGRQLWRAAVGALASRPLVDGDTIYVSADRLTEQSASFKEVYALNRGDGSVRWKTEIPNTPALSADALVLSQGRLFIEASSFCFDRCSAAYLFALDAAGGHLLWQQPLAAGEQIRRPVVDSAVLYTDRLLAVSVADGHQLWQGSASPYLVSGGVVYTEKALSAPDPKRPDGWKYWVVALDGTTGVPRWQTSTGGPPGPQVLSVVNGQVIIKTNIPNPQASQTTSVYLDVLLALDASDGTLRWRRQLDAYATSVAAVGGTLYLALPPPHFGSQKLCGCAPRLGWHAALATAGWAAQPELGAWRWPRRAGGELLLRRLSRRYPLRYPHRRWPHPLERKPRGQRAARRRDHCALKQLASGR